MIIVTGGAGFIGSNLVAGLEDRGHGPVIVCDRFGEKEKWRNLSRHDMADFVPIGELEEYLTTHAQDVDVVFHMGAISSTTEKDADLIVETNFKLSLNIWRFCAQNKIRFIYASSGSTYGDGSQGFVDDFSSGALKQLLPLNAYGWSKHVFDKRVCSIIEKKGATPPQWAGLKFFNVFGPNEHHKEDQRSVVLQLFEQVNAGGIAHLFKSYRDDVGDGEQSRDFVWVGDCVDVMLWLYENPDVNGLFNVGSGKTRTFNDLAQAVFKALDKPENIKYTSMPDGLKAKYQYFTQADMTNLRHAGYEKEFTSLEDAVHKYITEYLATDNPYR